MSRRLPPLNALRAFEAAARHTSFARAADELNVTPGAISQQVKALEERLGVQLFQRLPRGLSLTGIGERLRPKVGDALDRLAIAADEAMAAGGPARLRVSALPAFAEKWLVPRLTRFRKGHPSIEVALEADDRIADIAGGEADIALRYGLHPRAGLHVDRLFDDEIFPVCNPSMVDGKARLKGPGDLAQQTLLHDIPWTDDWRVWLDAAGVEGIDTGRGPSFTLYSMAVDAAAEGMGVLIGHRILVADDLKAGRLAEPFSQRVPLRKAFYLVCNKAAANQSAVRAFRDWILAEAKAD